MIIYLAGPMTGLPEFDHPAFHEAAARLRAQGLTVRSPAETDGGQTDRHYDYYMTEAIKLLMDSHAIALLPGWQESRGAKLEVTIAQFFGMEILDANTLRPIDVDIHIEFKHKPPKPDDRRHVVIAGSHHIYRNWCRDNGLDERKYFYVSQPGHLYGLDPAKLTIHLIGRHLDNSAYKPELLQILKERGAQIL